MNLQGTALLLRIFIGESDKAGPDYLYEKIVRVAKEQGLAGATVIKGIMSYGANSRIHRARLIELSEDLPIVIEMADVEEKINTFLPTVNRLMEECGRGGLVTIEKVDVLYYQSKK
ncbi:MAG: DUF190 domain-containing protein [Flavisolibacter sp.]|nr:DUF190 domain-containing protein [Flavisolibacter sp.]MBD0287743.1 DUF190 domain-containing protein [Flavisolibacter sp.]MBD0353112.1 DUF190 domain-containing protein [Flavisolibacter sp.]MBD0376682.1 DUF190 domain-containing protein [Flavisolibacter sp.]